jgi:hypothetical protein
VQGLLAADLAELSMDLAAAYPPAAGIRSWRRTMRLDRGGTGDGRILIADAWETSNFAERTVVHLIAAREPRRVVPGRLVIPADDDAGLAIDYSEADFAAGIEERPVDDSRLAATWGDRVYRITLAARNPGQRGALRLEITRYGRISAGQLIGHVELLA